MSFVFLQHDEYTTYFTSTTRPIKRYYRKVFKKDIKLDIKLGIVERFNGKIKNTTTTFINFLKIKS